MLSLLGLSGYISVGKDEVAKMIQYLTYNQSRIDRKLNPFETYEGYCFGFKGLVRESNTWEIKKFAGKLKQIVSLLTGIPVADLEKQSVKDSFLGSEWETFISLDEVTKTGTGRRPLKVRELLQRLGTDAMRDKVHPDCHVNSLFADYYPIKSEYYTGVEDSGVKEVAFEYNWPNWIISDTRFPNEAQAIKDRGGIVIRINRPFYGQEPIPVKHSSETSLDNWDFDYVIDNSGTIEELLEAVRTMLLHFKIIS